MKMLLDSFWNTSTLEWDTLRLRWLFRQRNVGDQKRKTKCQMQAVQPEVNTSHPRQGKLIWVLVHLAFPKGQGRVRAQNPGLHLCSRDSAFGDSWRHGISVIVILTSSSAKSNLVWPASSPECLFKMETTKIFITHPHQLQTLHLLMLGQSRAISQLVHL